jgi:hypothetical protein
VVEIRNERAKVELGEGVFGTCRLSGPENKQENKGGGNDKADISALTAMLAARWKSGPDLEAEQKVLRQGQVRQFRIVSLDAQAKRIELEIVSQ